MFGRRRTVPGNARVTTAVYFVPDAWSVQAASLSIATSTYSPMSSGVHSPGAGDKGFVGDRGFGVNRWAGAGDQPVQHFAGLAKPLLDPLAQRLGMGSGVSGQPGLPSTGDLGGALGWSIGGPGLGG